MVVKRKLPQQTLKRSVVVNDHRTAVSLEEAFWTALHEIATAKRARLSELVTAINRDRDRDRTNLSSAIRVHVLDYYRQKPSLVSPNRKPRT